jgi:hypothetical protein
MATHPEDKRNPDAPEPTPHDSLVVPPPPAEPESVEPVIQGPGGPVGDSDSAIELGAPAGSADSVSDSDLHPQPAESGITSGIAWAALMEELPEARADEIRIDSPSDADLLRESPPVEAKPPVGPEPTLIAPPAELSTFPPHRPGAQPPEPTPSTAGGGEEHFEQRDIFTADPTGRYPRPDTQHGVAGTQPSASTIPPAPAPVEQSRVDLGAATPGQLNPTGIESSIIDLGAIDSPGDMTPSGAVEEAELAPESSAIDLTAESGSGTGSGRDLIAEALESGIKFGPPPEPSDTGTAGLPAESAINFPRPPVPPLPTQKPTTSPFSSAIDFGGSPVPSSSPFSSAIEFGSPPTQKPGGSQQSSAIEFGGPSVGSSSPTRQGPPQAPPRPPTGSAISSAVDYSGAPETPQDSSSSVQLVPEEGDGPKPYSMRPPTMHSGTGRPATEPATPEDMEAEVHRGRVPTPLDSEIDYGSRPSSSDFEAPERPAKTDSDSDIDINIGELPEGAETAGSGLFVNANSGRLEPTDAAIDLDAEASAADRTATEASAIEAIEEQPEPKKKPSRRIPALAGKNSVPWLGGTGIGVVLGGAAVYLLQMFTGGSTPPKPTPPTSVQASAPAQPAPAPAPAPAAAPAASKFEMLLNGDLDKAAQAGIEQIDENNPEQLGRRGEYRWLAYLQRQRRSNGLLNGADVAVKTAAADLQAAADKGNADALFWLGHLQESTNAFDKAKATYAKGAAEAKDPLQKRRFEAALNRLELREAAKAARGPSAAEALLLALVALQAEAPAAAPPADGEEAGFGFWEAAKLAHEQKYAEAVQALDKARALHDQRRFARLFKAQNPLSDPTEEVFLRCADELKAYWQLEEQLHSGGYKAVSEVIAKAKDGDESKAQADKLAKEKEKSDAELTKLRASEKAAREESAAALTKAKDESEAKLKAAAEQIATGQTQLKAAAERERQLSDAKAAAEGELKTVTDELIGAKLLDAGAGRKGLLQGLQAAIKLATSADSQGTLRTLQSEVARFREQLSQRWQPGEMLTYWLPILGDRARTDLAGKAAIDANRVAQDASASPAEKARALAVLGLALRNQGNLAEAKAALEKARASLSPSDADWRERVDAALKEVADPAAYYVTRAKELQSVGKPAEAAAELEKAGKAYPAGAAQFSAQRALMLLEAAAARSGDRPAPNDPALTAARRAADEAAKSGDAYALYVAGRAAEEAGDYESAADRYRKAVAAHPGQDAAGSRYRLALARVLLRSSSAATPAEEAKPVARPADTTGRAPTAIDTLLALAVLLQAPAPSANQSEAIQLADEVLASPESTPEMRAQALAIKGMYTQALLTYADALRPVLSREQVETLRDLIRNHPALRRPESQAVPTPQGAERHYATGLRLLYSGQYPAAEKELLAAVAQDGQDARYYYFLGLTRMYQGKRDAFEDFEQGARLEQQGLPPGDAVNSALERVQGQARRVIDNARGLPR